MIGEKWQGVGVVSKKAKYMENSRGRRKEKIKMYVDRGKLMIIKIMNNIDIW